MLNLSATRFETKKSSIVREINLLEEKTKILQNAQCIAIERTECAFLKDAKEAEGKIAVLHLISRHWTTMRQKNCRNNKML